MNVTEHCCDTALIGLLDRHGITRAADRIPLRELESAWHREVGLRRSDLIAALNRLIAFGALLKLDAPDGVVVALTERGAARLRRPVPVAEVSADTPRLFLRLRETINTLLVLRRARQRIAERDTTPGATTADGGLRRRRTDLTSAELYRLLDQTMF